MQGGLPGHELVHEPHVAAEVRSASHVPIPSQLALFIAHIEQTRFEVGVPAVIWNSLGVMQTDQAVHEAALFVVEKVLAGQAAQTRFVVGVPAVITN